MERPRNFFSELKRRNVYKVAVAYAVIAWLLIQAASILFPTFEAPAWVMKVFVVIVAAGFVVALIIAWAFEMTPEGMKRTEEVGPNEKIPQWSRRKFAALILTITMMAAALLGYQVFRANPARVEGGVPATPNGDSLAGARPSISQKSIAVLPFENLSRDPENSFFSDGVQEEILTRLAKVADLKVISRTSTLRFKSAPPDLREIAKQLGVAHIVEGSVQKSADQVRVNVQLINALNDAHLWAETYDRKLTDIFAVESEIAEIIARTLQARLTGPETAALAKPPTVNPEAHELYLKGRFFWNKRTLENFQKAIGYFHQAIEKDPAYAVAYSGLADSCALLSSYGGAPANDAMPKAKAAALKALEIDPQLAEGHASLAQILDFYDWDYAGALREIDRAIELNPNYATAHQWRGEFLSVLERHDEAVRECKRALELDPLSVIINRVLGQTYFQARRYDEALAQSRKTVELEPSHPISRMTLGDAYAKKEMYAEAVAENAKGWELFDPEQGSQIAREMLNAYRLHGWRGYQEYAAESFKARAKQSNIPTAIVAQACAAANQKEEAFALLEKAYQERDYRLTLLKVIPDFDNLRSDRRFTDLLRRVHLQP